MGLFDKLTSALGGTNDKPEAGTATRADLVSVDDELLEETVNIERRADIIVEYYDAVSPDQALRIAEVLKTHLVESDTYSLRGIRQDVEDEVELPEEELEPLLRTEVSSIQVLRRIASYLERPDVEEHVFKWTGPSDSRTSSICAEVTAEVEERGGLPLHELEELLREKAEKYEEEGGTPERMNHWVPHEMCRHSIVRHVDF